MNPVYLFLALAIWILLAVIIAHYARTKIGITLEDFFLANRALGGFISAMTYSATTYSAFMMIGLVGFVYSSGVAAFGFEMTYLIFTVLLLSIFAPRFWSAGRKHGYITPPEMLADRYENRWVGVMASVISLVMLIPYTSVQLMGAGYLFSGLTDGQVPFMVGVLFMAAFSSFIALWAGMKSVSWTDALQALTMLVSAFILLFFVFYNFFGGPVGFFTTIQAEHPGLLKVNWDSKFFIGLSLPWAFFALTNPQVSQRLFVSKDIKSLKRMIIFFSIFGLIYTIITTLLGLAAADIVPGLNQADQAMPQLLTKIPQALAVIIFLGIFAAASSTLGSIMLSLSSTSTRDILKAVRPDVSKEVELFAGKLLIVSLMAVSVVFAWFQFSLIAILSAMASGGLLVLAPSMVGAFFWERGTDKGALFSMFIGGVTTVVLYILAFQIYGGIKWWPSIIGFSVTLLLFVGIGLITEAPEGAEDFIKGVEEEMERRGF